VREAQRGDPTNERCSERLERVLSVARPVRDIFEERVDEAEIPAWCEKRGWAPFLLSLDESSLVRCEARGLETVLPLLPDAPRDLRELAREVTAVTALPDLQGSTPLAEKSVSRVRYRKRAQLSRLLAAMEGMARRAERIVDVGSGSGHLTRLSAEHFGKSAVGLEREADRVASARARVKNESLATFVTMDAREGLSFYASDLAIGLHPCGELGDRLVQAAAGARCDVALVSCCLQKISAPVRAPLSTVAAGFELGKAQLGLTNLTAQPLGIEASIEVTVRTRETRYALCRLLQARGVMVEPGAEMRGINRRRAVAGLGAVAERALALRQLPPASATEIAHFEGLARKQYGTVRRLSLPRNLLSRLLEALVSLDRGAYLEEQGLEVQVMTLFDRAVSPRNIGVFASRFAERLPEAAFRCS
jgi:hypothetical protein